MRFFNEGLHSSTSYSIRTYCGAHKESRLHSLGRHATSLVKLQYGSPSPGTSIRKDNSSRPSSSGSSSPPTRTKRVTAIKDDEYSSSSPLKRKREGRYLL